jgi:hypothetical protein
MFLCYSVKRGDYENLHILLPCNETLNLPGSKAARQQGSKAARQQGSKAARQQGNKAARVDTLSSLRYPFEWTSTHCVAVCSLCADDNDGDDDDGTISYRQFMDSTCSAWFRRFVQATESILWALYGIYSIECPVNVRGTLPGK